jgi:hypothetical protein
MKRLAVVFVMAAVLGVCSQSYGYVLVYDVWSQVGAVDTQTNTMTNTMVWGKLAVDINDSNGLVVDANMVIFNRNRGGQGVYEIPDSIEVTTYGNSILAVIETSATGGRIIMTGSNGRRWGRNVGLADRRNVPNMLNGSIQFDGGVLFQTGQELVGGGAMTAMLNIQQTRDANGNGSGANDVINGIITFLQGRGFTELGGGSGGGPLPG